MVGVGHMLLGAIQAHDRKKVYIHHQYDSVMRIGEILGDCWRLLNYLFFFEPEVTPFPLVTLTEIHHSRVYQKARTALKLPYALFCSSSYFYKLQKYNYKSHILDNVMI